MLRVMLLGAMLLPPSGCGPELTTCEVDGAKFEVSAGMIRVYVNPVMYVRVYRDEWLETTEVAISVLNNGVALPGFPLRFRNFLTDPGGEYRCPRAIDTMGGASRLGIMVGTFPSNMPLNLSVRIAIRDTMGTATILTYPVRRLRPIDEDPPNFMCSSTRCGR